MDYFALYPQQGVQETGKTVGGIFDEFYRAQGNSRRNALLDFQLQSGEFNQGIATDQNNRAAEVHALQQETGQFKLDQAQGAQLYRAFEALEGLAPEARAAQIELMKPGLRERGFDDNDWAILATDEGLAQGKKILSQYKPVASNAATRDFIAKAEAAGLKPGTPEYEQAAKVDLGLAARAGSSAQERIAGSEDLTNSVADSKAVIAGAEAGAKETAKLEAQGKLKPEVEAEVTRAREQVIAEVTKLNEQKGQLGRYQDAQAIYEELVPNGSMDLLEKIYGRGESLYPKLLRSQEGINAMAMRDQLVSMLQLGARGELKGQGPITENEQAILSKAITILSEPDISPALAKQYFDNAMTVLGRNAGEVGSDQGSGKYSVGQIIEHGGQRYRVTGGDLSDPEVELVE